MSDPDDASEPYVPSPCVGICLLGPDEVCIGCLRTRDEVLSWPTASVEEKRAILDRCRERE